jgi:hypothetical protein
MISSNNRGKVGMRMRHHAIMVHGIAQLAIFRNNSTRRSRFGYAGKSFVLVSINGPLTRCKTKQQYPGTNYMAFIFIHYQNDARHLPFVASFRKNNQIRS